MREAGWTPEEDEQRPRVMLVISGVRCEHTVENRRRFMAEVRPQPAAADADAAACFQHPSLEGHRLPEENGPFDVPTVRGIRCV